MLQLVPGFTAGLVHNNAMTFQYSEGFRMHIARGKTSRTTGAVTAFAEVIN